MKHFVTGIVYDEDALGTGEEHNKAPQAGLIGDTSKLGRLWP